MSNRRGTRPTQPQRWPRRAEQQRQETEACGREVVRLIEGIGRTTNVYQHQAYLAEIRALGERITRLMIEAERGVEPEEARP